MQRLDGGGLCRSSRSLLTGRRTKAHKVRPAVLEVLEAPLHAPVQVQPVVPAPAPPSPPRRRNGSEQRGSPLPACPWGPEYSKL